MATTPRLASLIRSIKLDDIVQAEALLIQSGASSRVLLCEYDSSGYTPLMHAVTSSRTSLEMVRLLLARGADITQTDQCVLGSNCSALALAIGAGNPEKAALLLEQGANLRSARSHGSSAMLIAVHNRDVFRDTRLLDLLRLLIAHGAPLDEISSYQESALRVLSRLGRFDAVKLLLDAGADERQLQWTPLMRAVAIGTLEGMIQAFEAGAGLEDTDWWERTPWLLAIQTGDIAKARWLLDQGANREACGRCGKPPLFYAIECDRLSMLEWLLGIGVPLGQTDQFGTTPLQWAAENGSVASIDVLIARGADVDEERDGQTALSFAMRREIALRLLEAGANPRFLSKEGKRGLLGLPADPDETLLEANLEQYLAGREQRFGKSNPERVRDAFWEGMIRSGINAYQAAQRFKKEAPGAKSPIWCADRYGQSITFLPDGRIVQIAGEHEDWYDPDFCIYNDVFVHFPDGQIDIYAYPKEVFPPTDFHTATLVGNDIYVIGALGYNDARQVGHTPVFRLDTRSFTMHPVTTTGEGPGWIYQHRAILRSPGEIEISGGTIVEQDGSDSTHRENEKTYILDLGSRAWRVAD